MKEQIQNLSKKAKATIGVASTAAVGAITTAVITSFSGGEVVVTPAALAPTAIVITAAPAPAPVTETQPIIINNIINTDEKEIPIQWTPTPIPPTEVAPPAVPTMTADIPADAELPTPLPVSPTTATADQEPEATAILSTTPDAAPSPLPTESPGITSTVQPEATIEPTVSLPTSTPEPTVPPEPAATTVPTVVDFIDIAWNNDCVADFDKVTYRDCDKLIEASSLQRGFAQGYTEINGQLAYVLVANGYIDIEVRPDPFPSVPEVYDPDREVPIFDMHPALVPLVGQEVEIYGVGKISFREWPQGVGLDTSNCPASYYETATADGGSAAESCIYVTEVLRASYTGVQWDMIAAQVD